MNLGELVIQLGVKADTFTVRDFSRAIGDIPVSVAGAISSMAGLSYGFVEMTKNVLDMTSGFQVFTAETGLNTKALQQWQQVAKEAGLSGDIVTNALSSLAGMMGAMRTGHINHGAMVALGQLGVGGGFLNMTPYELLNEIQRAALRKNPMEATSLLGALGLSPEMMRLFQTPQGVRERITPAMGGGDIAAMTEFQKSLAEFNHVAMHEFVKVLTDVQPFMKDLTEVLRQIIILMGRGVVSLMEDLHYVMQAKREGYNLPDLLLFHGDPRLAGKAAGSMIYNGGNLYFNVAGLSDAEQAYRHANEFYMRKSMLERQHAASTFNQAGS